MSAILSSVVELVGVVDDFASQVPLSAFAQEIVVMTVFLVSFWSWRYVRKGPKSKLTKDVAAAKLRSGFDSPSLHTDERKTIRAPAEKLHPCPTVATPAVKAAEKQMLQCLEQREFTKALNMYRGHERDGREQYFSEELFSSFVQSSIRVGKVDVVERMLRAMRKSSMAPSLPFWQTTLKMLSSRKFFSVCLSVHSIYGKHMPADKTIYSCLINAALEVAAPDKALALLERYEESGIDARDYVLFFRTYVALGDADNAEACFKKLGVQMSTLMLNLLLLTCVQTNDPERAHRLLRQAHVLMEGKDQPEENMVDTVSYNTVIKGYARNGEQSKCSTCLHEMLEKGIEPDDVTFGTLLDACIADDHMTAATEVVNLLVSRDKPMDTVMSTLFIKGLVRVNCLPKALELYEGMRKREGAHPDIVTYSVLIKALVDNKELERALKLLQDMSETGMRPDDIILTHLLEGCRLLGNHTLGKKIFADLLELGVKPSDFTLVTMLKLHGRVGAHQEAYDLVSTWEEKHGQKPSVIHYTCIMSGCLRTKKYDEAWTAYELMCSRGVVPDATTVTTLLPGMAVAQQWERVLTIVRRALKCHVPVVIPTETLNSALSQMRMSAQGSHSTKVYSDQLIKLMQEGGVPVTARKTVRAN